MDDILSLVIHEFHFLEVVMSLHKGYIEVGYEDKVVFMLKEEDKRHSNIRDAWRRSQGLWAHHPIFQGMTTKEIIEWLRGDDCDA